LKLYSKDRMNLLINLSNFTQKVESLHVGAFLSQNIFRDFLQYHHTESQHATRIRLSESPGEISMHAFFM
jgi:hypothetical protein